MSNLVSGLVTLLMTLADALNNVSLTKTRLVKSVHLSILFVSSNSSQTVILQSVQTVLQFS